GTAGATGLAIEAGGAETAGHGVAIGRTAGAAVGEGRRDATHEGERCEAGCKQKCRDAKRAHITLYRPIHPIPPRSTRPSVSPSRPVQPVEPTSRGNTEGVQFAYAKMLS